MYGPYLTARLADGEIWVFDHSQGARLARQEVDGWHVNGLDDRAGFPSVTFLPPEAKHRAEVPETLDEEEGGDAPNQSRHGVPVRT